MSVALLSLEGEKTKLTLHMLFWYHISYHIDLVSCRMALLLGPPSSGKTTLLLALAGKLGSDLQVSKMSILPTLIFFFLIVLVGIIHTSSKIRNNKITSTQNLCGSAIL